MQRSGLKGSLMKLLWLVAVLISIAPVPTAAQSKAIHELLYVLPIIIVTIIIIGIAILVICVMYRAKRGYFCCFSPTPFRFPQTAVDDNDSLASEEEQRPPESLPPTYNTNQVPPPVNIAPPDYRDAMQDPLVASGSPQDKAVDPSGETETALRSPVSPTPPQVVTASPVSPPATSEPTSEPVEELQTSNGEPPQTDVGIDLDDGSDSLDDADDRTPLNP